MMEKIKQIVLILLPILLLCGCLNFVSNDKEPSNLYNSTEQAIIEEFFLEHGLNYSLVRYEYEEIYGRKERKAFYICLRNESSVKNLILTDKLNALLDNPYYLGLTVKSVDLDSITIITDSVIIIPRLLIGGCGITEFPAEIGKLRVRHFDISNNYMLPFPEEIQNMDSFPQPYSPWKIAFNGPAWNDQEEWGKEWLFRHNIELD